MILAVGLPTGAGAAVAWGVQIPLLIFVLVGAFVPNPCCYGMDLFPTKKESMASQLTTEAEPKATVEEATPKQPKKRMHWLDNLKTFLIIGVVLGHTAMTFSLGGAGINFEPTTEKTWFMMIVLILICIVKPLVVPLFFFISGFFAPSSLDRKGPQGFMRANFLRYLLGST